jgi:hypothetical protein
MRREDVLGCGGYFCWFNDNCMVLAYVFLSDITDFL